MCAHGRRGVHATELWAEKVRICRVRPEISRRWRSVRGWVQQLIRSEELMDAIRPSPMTEVDAFGHPSYALRSDRDRAVDVLRHRSRRSGLLPDEAPVTNEHRIRRIAQVVDLGHSFRPPGR